MTTKKQRRRDNLLAGKLTPKWARVDGPVMRQFRQQMGRKR